MLGTGWLNAWWSGIGSLSASIDETRLWRATSSEGWIVVEELMNRNYCLKRSWIHENYTIAWMEFELIRKSQCQWKRDCLKSITNVWVKAGLMKKSWCKSMLDWCSNYTPQWPENYRSIHVEPLDHPTFGLLARKCGTVEPFEVDALKQQNSQTQTRY